MLSGDDTQRLVPSPDCRARQTPARSGRIWKIGNFEFSDLFSQPSRSTQSFQTSTRSSSTTPPHLHPSGLSLSNMSEQDSGSESRNLQSGMEEMRQTAQRMMKQAIMEGDAEIRNWLHGGPNKKRAELIYPLF
uniref:Uncharacterized protein n=1 Tax=Cryptococcus bacillisporus CA1280 TaxID=1296109 RepID=A0A0D0TF21_CRYGA|nr:hypothetical protein I312_05781 [Cryptococcus bacillisporus CA1280]